MVSPYLATSCLRANCLARSSQRPFLRLSTIVKLSSLRMASTLPNSAIFKTLAGHDPAKVAVIHSQSGRAFTYGSLLHDIAATKDVLWERGQKQSLRGERIAFLAENGYDYVGK